MFYFYSGGTNIYRFDGASTVTTVASVGGVTYVKFVVYNQRLLGITGNSQRIYWSDFNNGDTIGDSANGGGFADLRQPNLGTISDIVVVGDTLYMLHTNGVSTFTGWSFDDI